MPLVFEVKSPICSVALLEGVGGRITGAVRVIREAAGWRLERASPIAPVALVRDIEIERAVVREEPRPAPARRVDVRPYRFKDGQWGGRAPSSAGLSVGSPVRLVARTGKQWNATVTRIEGDYAGETYFRTQNEPKSGGRR